MTRFLLIPIAVGDDVSAERGEEIIRDAMSNWAVYGAVHLTNASGVSLLDPRGITYNYNFTVRDEIADMAFNEDYKEAVRMQTPPTTTANPADKAIHAFVSDSIGSQCPVCGLPAHHVLHLLAIAPPVPAYNERIVAEYTESEAPEEPEHTGWSGEPHPGRHF